MRIRLPIRTFAFLEIVTMLAVTSVLALNAQTQTEEPRLPCAEANFEATVSGGQSYARELGSGLFLKLMPSERSEGWLIQVTPKDGDADDYAYPLNPPLRQANSQWLATGYGLSVREQLSHDHDVRFILSSEDYERIFKLTTDALWPYQAANPDQAAQVYLDAIGQARAGLVRVHAKRFDTNSDGTAVNWATLELSVFVPGDFELAPDLKSARTACPGRR